jgi:hypothetical protein
LNLETIDLLTPPLSSLGEEREKNGGGVKLRPTGTKPENNDCHRMFLCYFPTPLQDAESAGL